MAPAGEAEVVALPTAGLAKVIGLPAAQTLADELDLRTVSELLRYYPVRYGSPGRRDEDDAPMEIGEKITVVGDIVKTELVRTRGGKQIFKIIVESGRRTYHVTFFNVRGHAKVLHQGVRVMLSGKLGMYREQYQLSHPNWLILSDDDESVGPASPMLKGLAKAVGEEPGGWLAEIDRRPLLPMYKPGQSVETWEIWRCALAALRAAGEIDETLRAAVRDERGLIGLTDALRGIHDPSDEAELARARERLRFDEAMALQLALAQRRLADRDSRGPECPHVAGGLEDTLRGRLPFRLTEGQELVLAEITADFVIGAPASRLLQGEVGSGKTLVALLAMLRMVDNGYQAALLAPTEVLAAQHYRTITGMLGPLAEGGLIGGAEGATRVALVTGSMRTAAKRDSLLDAISGDAGIVIGTHALLSDNVDFFNLGLVVVDEQHRFGVEQRDKLRARGRDVVPHVLVMTATPIPRTVAMTVFGDLESSSLTELPAGRQPIKTSLVAGRTLGWLPRVWQRVGEEAAAGRQVYVVCSRIGDEPAPAKSRSKAKKPPAEEPTTKAALEMYDELREGPLGRFRIGLLHGRMPPDEKSGVMAEFTAGAVDILISTTVIEVGVDVPNATTMVVMDADRFGVSQLHQLRGRVGRGGLPGLCLLVSESSSEASLARLDVVASSTDGAFLAEEDLRQRREGDLLGSLQSGARSSLHFLSLLTDGEVLADTRELAEQVVGEDLYLASEPGYRRLVDELLGPVRLEYLDKS